MFSIRTAAGPIEYRDERAPEWLQIIWEANGIEEGFFGQPVIEEWWAGGTVEKYEHAYVLHRTDPSVSIIAQTEHGEKVLRQAAANLGIHIN